MSVIYVSHCALEVVQWQSSLICLNSLTQRLALVTLWQHDYIIPCIPKQLIKEAGQMADDTDQTLIAIISERLLFIALFPPSLFVCLYLCKSDTSSTRQKFIGRNLLHFVLSILRKMSLANQLYWSCSLNRKPSKQLQWLLVPFRWDSVMQ